MNRYARMACIVGVLGYAAVSRRAACAEEVAAPDTVNIRDFAGAVADDDWSGAIQAAFDHVSVENGYRAGTTILFPPGTYRINRPLTLGKQPEHYGTRLSGTGAILLGTKALDEYPSDYETRLKDLAESGAQKDYLTAMPGELDFEGNNVGTAILEVWNPPGTEGASVVIEGLTFDRESRGHGVGIKIPAETVPKNVPFRDIKVHRQNVGVHVNYSWQIRFESCLIRGNQIGIWGRNHFNSVQLHCVRCADPGGEFGAARPDCRGPKSACTRGQRRRKSPGAGEHCRDLAGTGRCRAGAPGIRKAFLHPAADQLHLRAYIQMLIADSYMREKDYENAEKAYAKALKIGPGGWHKGHCEKNLEKARELAAGQQP